MRYEYNLGKVLLTPKGDYSDSVTYEKLDVVTYNRSSYVAKVTTQGNVPTNEEYWQLMAGGGGVEWDDVTGKPDFADVATSGSYNDLVDKPTIPAAQVNSDWNASSGVAQILNKPQLSAVATSGSYNDLNNKPTIPAAQVNSDWNASSGVAQILNKPQLSAVATSGNYNDLNNKLTEGNGIDISSSNVVSVEIDTTNANGLDTTSAGLKLGVAQASTGGAGGSAGAMSAADKEKLDGIEAGAEENVIETVKVSGTALQVANKAVNIETETAYNPSTNKIATMSDVNSATPNVGSLNTNNTSALTPSASESFTGDISLHKVSKTGSYSDLNSKPQYLSQFDDDLGSNPVHTHSQYLTSSDISGKADKVQNATAGNFAGLDSTGNLTDSEHNADELVPSGGTTGQVLAKHSNRDNDVEWITPEEVELLVPITYSDLVTLKTGGNLVPGTQYRITDYTCTTTQSNTQSAGHVFDVIVIADSETELNENARVALHSGDTYFQNCNLDSWELKYCLENDTNSFAWADSTNGKGVIYYIKDEFDNECPYDFKNILFTVGGTNYYTFDTLVNSVHYDLSVAQTSKGCYGNIIEEYYTASNGVSKLTLGKNIFKNTSLSSACYSNTFGNGCNNNTFGKGCYSNTFGNGCKNNSFGDYCNNNSFGNSFQNNSFGNDCQYNSFGNRCQNNTLGDKCYYNSFGNDCQYNSFGNYRQNITVFDGVKYCNVTGGTQSAPVKNAQILNGTAGASSANKLNIAFSANKNYTQVAGLVNGTTLRIWIAEDTVTGPSSSTNNNIALFNGTTGKIIKDSGLQISDIADMVETTWSALRVLKNGGNLVPGMQYRITDYTCVTTQTNTQSAGHLFDIIVTADSETELNENARAAHHTGDTYFQDCNLDAWELKYCIDNDSDRFAWISNDNYVISDDVEMVKPDSSELFSIYGVEDFMNQEQVTESEYGSDRHIGFFIWSSYSDRNVYGFSKDGGQSVSQDLTITIPTQLEVNSGTICQLHVYVDPDIDEDGDVHLGEINGDIYEGGIGKGVVYYMKDEWNNIAPFDFKNMLFTRDTDWFVEHETWAEDVLGFVPSTDMDFYFLSWVTQNNEVQDLSIVGQTLANDVDSYDGVYNNETKGTTAYDMGISEDETSTAFALPCTIIVSSYNNDLGNFYGCYGNSFGNGCFQNSFGNYCQSNSFSNDCYSNTFGNSCYSNSFGNNFFQNSFGNECYSNSFGNDCSSNSFGNNCYSNTFGNSCYRNTFGNDCSSNSFGNNCYSNTFGNICHNNSFGNYCEYNSFGGYCQDITIFDNVRFCNITGGTSSAPVKNAQILNGTKGASSSNKLTITFTANQDYTQVAGLVDGTTLRIWIAEDTVTGPTTATNNRIAVFDGTTGKVIKDGGVTVEELLDDVPEYTIEKLGTAETGYIASYRLLKDNVQEGATINIPKDYLVKSGSIVDVVLHQGHYYESTDTSHAHPLDSYGVNSEGKYLKFVVNTVEGTGDESCIYISVSDLVDVYTAGNGIDISNYVVSVKIDTANANGLDTTSAGLKLGVAQASTGGAGGSAGAMSASDKEKLDGIEAGAEANVQSDWEQDDNTADDFIKHKPTIGNGTVTINQGGEMKGSFTMNQSGDTVINLGQGIASVGWDDVTGKPDFADVATSGDYNDLINRLTEGNGIDISNSNVVSVEIDTANANGLDTTSAGLKLGVAQASTGGAGGSAGAMSAADKEKLDGIEAGAEENVIETVKVSGTALQVVNKAVNIETGTAYDPSTNKIATMSDVTGAMPNVGSLNTNNTSALTPSASESFGGSISLHKVSKTGSYDDLNNKRTSLSQFVDDLGSSPVHTHSQYLTSSDIPVTDVTVDGSSVVSNGVAVIPAIPTIIFRQW